MKKQSLLSQQNNLANSLPNNNILYNNFMFAPSTVCTGTTFEGYASIFNIVDKQYDIIVPGAFSNIKNKENRAFTSLLSSSSGGQAPYTNNFTEPIEEPIIPILWQHNINEPIGKVLYLEQNNKGLYIKASLITEIPRGYEAYKLLENKVINGLSIGYIPKKFSTDPKQGYRIINSIDLIEISLVTFPANYGATITSLSTIENKKEGYKIPKLLQKTSKKSQSSGLANLISLLREP